MRIGLLVIALVAFLLVPVIIWKDEIDNYFSGEEGLGRLQAYGTWAWLIGIGLIVSDLVLPMPSTAVIAALGMLYGGLLGGLIGGVGSILAGLVAYGGCRLLGERFLNFLVGEESVRKLDRFFERYGLWAIALSRWMPLLPEALCCLAGMVRMRFWPFLAALACGSMAMGFAFAFLGRAYLDAPVVGLIISALIPLAVWPIVHIYFRRRPVLEHPPTPPERVE